MNQFDNNYNDQYERTFYPGLKLTGSALQYVGYSLLVALGTVITLGIAYPFLMSRLVKWCVEHTTYNGRYLRFIGSSVDLYIKIIIFWLIGIFTFGIGFLFYGYYFVKWIIENIVVE